MTKQESGLSFNDIPTAISRLLNEVGDIRQMLVEMRRNDKPSTPDRHIPMSVDEAAEYLKIPKARSMTNSPKEIFLRPNPASGMYYTRTSLTSGWIATGVLRYR